MDLNGWLRLAADSVGEWQASYSPFEPHPSLQIADGQFTAAFDVLADRMRGNYPYFHPSYAGQMLKPPHPAAVAGYLAAMLVNPNNQALEAGKVTSELEKEVVAQLAAMFGLTTHLGHLTSSGTIANLEALYVARETHPGLGVAFSEEAHYTHSRMCRLLSVPTTVVPADRAGRIDSDALERVLAGGRIGTVVATAGTTGLGAVDPVHEVVPIARRYGVRVHVDAAYGGFYTLLAGADGRARLDPRPWRAIADCDSVVVDPHKHGLQPYGCGAVLFADPGVGRFYAHNSPYTYYVSGERHLGEISLECSRAGAAAAALWLTFRLLPPTPDGLGRVLAACRIAALDWADLLQNSELLRLYQPPDLDIVSYFPATIPASLAEIDRACSRILSEGATDTERPVFVSTLTVTADALTRRHADVTADRDNARILRSVLMKPESETYVRWLHSRLEELAACPVRHLQDPSRCRQTPRSVPDKKGFSSVGGHLSRDSSQR
jgi:glutamate/tyrosine decarboxylase-like PLP-dependent enzyme